MSKADMIFINNCKAIMNSNLSDEPFEEVRAKWPGGKMAYTKKILFVHNEYDLQEEFPILTIRKQAFKNAYKELLWIYQKCSNDVRDLGLKIWNDWAENNTIGKAYGYQIGKLIRHHRYEASDDIEMENYPSMVVKDEGSTGRWVWMNQIDAVIWDLKHKPASRSIIMNMYDMDDLSEMNLRPCAYNIQFLVTYENDETYLNAVLTQRSQDMFVANNWNVIQYALLVHMLAQVCGMKPGKLAHNISDCHIYIKHMDDVRRMVELYDESAEPANVKLKDVGEVEFRRDQKKLHGDLSDVPYPAPKLIVDPTIKRFSDFTEDSFSLEGYQWRFDFRPEVAV